MKTFILTLFLFALSLSSLSLESIGRVVKIHGDVLNHYEGAELSLKKGDHLYVGAKLVSGKRSFIKIMMKDDTIFQLGPNSEFSLEKFEFKSKSEREAVYNLAKGKLRSLFTVKAPTRSLKIKTPTASMGVRGTEILSDVYKLEGKITTDIALLSGSLEVQAKGVTKKIMMQPGFVYKSSLGNSIDKIAVRGEMRRMDRRVFARAKSSKDIKNVFLSDVRSSVDAKLTKGIKFETTPEKTKEEQIRVPATNDLKPQMNKEESSRPSNKMNQHIKPQTMDIKTRPAIDEGSSIKFMDKNKLKSKLIRENTLIRKTQFDSTNFKIDQRSLPAPKPIAPTDTKPDAGTITDPVSGQTSTP
ncbi:FecR domain-containing protein [Halobacteriovorax sp. HLS]|uniref:FecR family protein n=1 Tax=Halobacteriovorax sp. HLS TaxID=2234000 RepID=UPI000FD91CE4|nr:FecR family protein [Halobacteriovorax sp. HLS]